MSDFLSLEVVGRGSETQLQVGGALKGLRFHRNFNKMTIIETSR